MKAKLKLPLPLALYVVGALCRALAYVHTRERRRASRWGSFTATSARRTCWSAARAR